MLYVYVLHLKFKGFCGIIKELSGKEYRGLDRVIGIRSQKPRNSSRDGGIMASGPLKAFRRPYRGVGVFQVGW